MLGVFKKFGEFIKKIQRSDDRTKNRWLVTLSGAGMLIIIVLWLGYLSVTLPQTPAAESTSTEPVAPLSATGEGGSSFFETLGRGWDSIWSGIKSSFDDIGRAVSNNWLKLKDEMSRTNDINLEKPAGEMPSAPLP